jgi:hypothetical protein
MSLNRHFRDMLLELSASKTRFLIVGAYALAALGVPRATGDIDLWIRPDPENARRAYEALRRFGAPLTELSPDDLARPGTVFQIGLPPNRIDILTSITGVEFDEAWRDRLSTKLDGVDVAVLGRDAFLRNKRAVGRLKDLADVEYLEPPERPIPEAPGTPPLGRKSPDRKPRPRKQKR